MNPAFYYKGNKRFNQRLYNNPAPRVTGKKGKFMSTYTIFNEATIKAPKMGYTVSHSTENTFDGSTTQIKVSMGDAELFIFIYDQDERGVYRVSYTLIGDTFEKKVFPGETMDCFMYLYKVLTSHHKK